MLKRYLRFCALLVLGCLGYFLLGAPAGPDVPFPFQKQFGCACLFLFWMACLREWGFLLQEKMQLKIEGFAASYALGLAFAGLVAFILGQFSRLSYTEAPLLCVILLVAPLLSRRPLKMPAIYWRPSLFFPVIPFLYLILLSVRPHSNWDALWYHLVGPRLWANAGKIYFPVNEVMAFHAGSWDFLYIWPQILMGAPGGGGLIAAQYFSQWIHLSAFVATGFILYLHFQKICEDKTWLGLATFAALFSAPLFYTAVMANNDWGAIFWFFVGAHLLGQKELRFSQALAAGVFLGLSLSAKWTIAFSLIPFLLAFQLYPAEHKFNTLSMGLILGILPIALRNFLGTGNPFFPLFSGFFATSLPHSWQHAFDSILGEKHSPLSLLWELFWVSPFFILGIFLVFFEHRSWRRQKLLWSVLASLALICAFGGDNFLLRWWGPGLILASALFFLHMPIFFVRFSAWKKYEKGVQLVFFLALFFLTPLDWRIFTKNPFLMDPALQIRMHPGGQAAAWLRLNAEKESIAVLNDNRIYYLDPLNYVRIWDSLPLDAQLKSISEAEDLLVFLQQRGFTLLLDSAESIDRYQSDALIHKIRKLIAEHPGSLRFSDASARVVNISLLLKEL